MAKEEKKFKDALAFMQGIHITPEEKRKSCQIGDEIDDEWSTQFRSRVLLTVPERPGALRTKRNRIRIAHGKSLQKRRDERAPRAHIHHEWVPGTANYRGIAFVEAKAHLHGVIKVIEVVDGEITLLTEKKRKYGKQKEE